MTTEKRQAPLLENLQIPVNPNYDWNKDPSEQANYFNPVTLCNREVAYANKIIEIASKLAAANKQLAVARLRARTVRREITRIEAGLLGGQEPPKEYTKNLVLQAAYVQQLVRGSEYADNHRLLSDELITLEDSIEEQDAKINSGYKALDALKLASQNLQTALSFYKAEMKTTFR